MRNERHWSQQHLADAAGIVLRTVQRVEKGDGVSLETLAALSNAFDVSIDVLQTDVDALAEQLRREHEALQRTHDVVAVAPVTCSAQMEEIGAAAAARDAFAALKANLTDMIDIWEDVDPCKRREWAKDAFEQVEELNRLGVVVCVANRSASRGSAREPIG